jgi:hypothetical protein
MSDDGYGGGGGGDDYDYGGPSLADDVYVRYSIRILSQSLPLHLMSSRMKTTTCSPSHKMAEKMVKGTRHR